MRNSGRCSPRRMRSSSTLRQASALSPPMLLIASSTFWPSSRTPRTTRSEMEVALRSSRTRTTVPSRINRTIGSSASERAFQASQSVFTLRQVRLTVSLPTVPPNKAPSARRTRRVLVPARIAGYLFHKELWLSDGDGVIGAILLSGGYDPESGQTEGRRAYYGEDR